MVDSLNRLLDGIRNLDRVRLRPADYTEADDLLPIQQAVAFRLSGAIEGLCDIADIHVVTDLNFLLLPDARQMRPRAPSITARLI